MHNISPVAFILQRVHLNLVINVKEQIVLASLQAIRSQIIIGGLERQVNLLIPRRVRTISRRRPVNSVLECDLNERPDQRLASYVLMDLDRLSSDRILYDSHRIAVELVFPYRQVVGIHDVDEKLHVLRAQILACELLALAAHRVEGPIRLHIQIVEDGAERVYVGHLLLEHHVRQRLHALDELELSQDLLSDLSHMLLARVPRHLDLILHFLVPRTLQTRVLLLLLSVVVLGAVFLHFPLLVLIERVAFDVAVLVRQHLQAPELRLVLGTQTDQLVAPVLLNLLIRHKVELIH